MEPAATPSSRPFLLQCGALLLENSEFLLARHIYSKLLAADLRDAEALKGVAICFLRMKNLPGARKCLTNLIEMHGSEEAYFWLGLCFVAEGEDAQAIESFQNISHLERLAPKDRILLEKEKGNAFFRLGRSQDAEAAYRMALQFDKGSDVLHVNLGTLYLLNQRLPEAEEYFKLALRLKPNSRAYSGLALCALPRGEKRAARDHFIEALELDGCNRVALIELYSLCDEDRDFSPILKRLEVHLEGEPRDYTIRFMLASAYFKEGQWGASEKELDELLKLKPDYSEAGRLRAEIKRSRHQN